MSKNGIIQDFLKRYYHSSIMDVYMHYPSKESITIDYMIMEQCSKKLTDLFTTNPLQFLERMEEEVLLIDVPFSKKIGHIHIRMMNLPQTIPIRDIRCKHLDQFISVEGLVRRITEVTPTLIKGAFLCSVCKEFTFIQQFGEKLTEPKRCSNTRCNSSGPFFLNTKNSTFKDSQRAVLQESPEMVMIGNHPQNLVLDISHDLTGILSPGNKVIVNGVLCTAQKVQSPNKLSFSLKLDVNSIEFLDREYEEIEISVEEEQQILSLSKDPNIYEKLIHSIAPTIYGNQNLRDVKEAILLQLFSSHSKHLPDGSRVRGDIHVLLVGDPGVAKSQLLQFITRLSPKSIYTSGKSSSASGLTASAVKDEFADGRWSIEGGALVMADGGIVAVDEMDKMRDEDISALHEAMEQQTISIAKAGILTTMKSRCSLLGAANPKIGRFDRSLSIAEQLDMPPALLSRFDFIFILMDIPNREGDQKIATHILRTQYAGEVIIQQSSNTDSVYSSLLYEDSLHAITPEIDTTILRKYISYAKKNISPILTEEAMNHLNDFYLSIRSMGSESNSPIPITARQLESIIRISEAVARAHLSDTITIDYAQKATRIIIECLKQVGIDPESGKLDIDYIMVGNTKSDQLKINTVRSIIKNLSEECSAINNGNSGISISSILHHAEKQNIPKDNLMRILDRLYSMDVCMREGEYIHYLGS